MKHTLLLLILTLILGCSHKDSIWIELAEKKLMEMDVPFEGREVKVSGLDKVVVVEFLPPVNGRAGSYIIKIDKGSREILDTKIWR